MSEDCVMTGDILVKRAKQGRPLFALFSVLLALFILSLTACSTRQAKMSPIMAILNNSTFSPDGKVIAAGRNAFNVILLYDASTARFMKALIGEEDRIGDPARSVSISRDGRFLAAAGVDDMVVVWDLGDDRIKNRFADLKGALQASFSPAGNLLAVAAPGNEVTLLTIPEGDRIGQLTGHRAPVISMAFSPDGTMLATGSSDRSARIWSVPELQQIREFGGSEYPVHSVSFSPDGYKLAAYSGALRIWQWGAGGTHTVSLPESQSSSVQSVAALTMLLAGARSVQLGGGPLGFLSFSDRGDAEKTVSQRLPALFSPDGKILALVRYHRSWSGDYEIVLYYVETGTTKVVPCNCRSISFSPDGTRLAAVGSFGVSESVRLLDPVTAEWIQRDKK